MGFGPTASKNDLTRADVPSAPRGILSALLFMAIMVNQVRVCGCSRRAMCLIGLCALGAAHGKRRCLV